MICYSSAGNNLRCSGLNGTRAERPGPMLSPGQAAIRVGLQVLVMINNSDPGCVWSRPVYLVLQCLQCLQWWQHPGPGVRLPRTAELLQAGVCSVCTPGLQCCSLRPLSSSPAAGGAAVSALGRGMKTAEGRADGLGRMDRSTFTLSKT